MIKSSTRFNSSQNYLGIALHVACTGMLSFKLIFIKCIWMLPTSFFSVEKNLSKLTLSHFSDVKSKRSLILITLCWSCLSFSLSCFSELAELKWLVLFCFWCSLRMELLWTLILDISVLTYARYSSFRCTSKILLEFLYSSLPISVFFDKVMLLSVLFIMGILK